MKRGLIKHSGKKESQCAIPKCGLHLRATLSQSDDTKKHPARVCVSETCSLIKCHCSFLDGKNEKVKYTQGSNFGVSRGFTVRVGNFEHFFCQLFVKISREFH